MNKIYKPETSNISEEAKIGSDCVIHSHVWIGEATIGNRVKIQAFSFIPKGVILGDDVFIGPGVKFMNDKYPPSKGKFWQEIIVKSGASIGGGSIILAGVIIGSGAKIGAGSVVTKSVPDGEVWLGNAAHKYMKKNDTIR